MRGTAPIVVLALAAVALGGLGVSGASPHGPSARQPTYLHGAPLGSTTGLRLLVANDPPFVVDVDTGRVTPVRGLPPVEDGVVWVVGVAGRDAVIASDELAGSPRIFAAAGRGTRAIPLGRGMRVMGANSGTGVWIQSAPRASRCNLRLVGFDGRLTRAPRAFDCGFVEEAGALGLAVRRRRIIDPASERTVFSSRAGIVAAAGRSVLLAESGYPVRLTMVDTATGERRPIRWPDGAGALGDLAADPRGRFVALTFGIPSASPQILDVWVLNTETGTLIHPPAMPTLVGLKFTSLEWTDDGRLVMLAERRDGEGTVVVWRPGQKRLALKTLPMPAPNSGSPSFAPIR